MKHQQVEWENCEFTTFYRQTVDVNLTMLVLLFVGLNDDLTSCKYQSISLLAHSEATFFQEKQSEEK